MKKLHESTHIPSTNKRFQIKSNQIKSDQIKSNQIKSDQIKSAQINTHPAQIFPPGT